MAIIIIIKSLVIVCPSILVVHAIIYRIMIVCQHFRGYNCFQFVFPHSSDWEVANVFLLNFESVF